MATINGVTSVNGVGGVAPLSTPPVGGRLAAGPAAATRQPVGDRVELSVAADFVQRLQANNPRAGMVEEIRGLIRADKYETDEKLDIAINRLLDDLEL